MSVISAGLAATIREWFSEGENITTVEKAKKVDLKKVRVKKKAKRKAPKKKAKAKKAKPTELTAEAVEVVAEKPEPTVEEVPEETKEEVTAPPEPEPVLPAGPILEKPEPAQLSGPQVIRVESPEPTRPAAPKSRKRYDAAITEPLMYNEVEDNGPAFVATKDKKRGVKQIGERTHGRRREQRSPETPRRAKYGKWRQTDIKERQARLEAASGESLRLRPVRKIAVQVGRGVAPLVRPKKAVVSGSIAVKDLSAALAVKTADIITKLMQQGMMATANQIISCEAAELVALEFGAELVVERKAGLEEQIQAEFEERQRKNLKKRSVVATMLGHVDHGKTSLLDKIRSSQTAAGEAGGITQHIGAYQVSRGDHKVTFLDTPGHEAFTAMRARGADLTDVAVLVIAADDGVMPQTIEAIAHSRAANIPVIVALNKIDLPGRDVNRIYSQLAEQELTPTEWSGETEVVKTSAVTGEGIDDLLEHLNYVSELLELKADDTIPATGWVVEAKMSAKRGPAATLLIKEGKLSKGGIVLAGGAYGRVKTLKNSYGKTIKTATSSMPVEITGLSDVPLAGDRFYCLDDINRAKAAAEENQVHQEKVRW